MKPKRKCPRRELRATRYLTARNEPLAQFIASELPYLDLEGTLDFYNQTRRQLQPEDFALLGANDRFFLLTGMCSRRDMLHPWVFARCREVESAPDGYLDLWAREHYKSTIITFGGLLQEILIDPEITIGVFSWTKAAAAEFVGQIKREAESNEALKIAYPDVLWWAPRSESPLWTNEALIFKRRGNPKEATIEAQGLTEGLPTGPHYQLMNYDDVVTKRSCTSPEMVRKTTEGWEMSDNLGSGDARKRYAGTRYAFGDTYQVIMDRKAAKPRIYPATENGRKDGKPVLFTAKVWEQKKRTQASTLAAQLLLNPLAGSHASFNIGWLRGYEILPATLNVYIMGDPSRGKTKRSDRTAIVVIGIDSTNNKYLLDGFCHRMNLRQRWEALSQMHRKWVDMPGIQMVKVGYERYGQQSDDEYFQEQMRLAKDQKGVFAIEELNWAREGAQSKQDRVERLQPDMEQSKFWLPAVVHHETHETCMWKPAEETDQAGENVHTGEVIYTKLTNPTRNMDQMIRQGQRWRVATAIKRRDEEGNVYDLTRAFIEEMKFFPFGSHDDCIDAASRIYDMEPMSAQVFERVDEPVYPDA